MTSTPEARTALQLPDTMDSWLGRQRWFAGKSQQLQSVETRLLASLDAVAEGSEPVEIWLLEAVYADGERETYQTPVVRKRRPDDALAHAYIGQVDSMFCYDATADKSATPQWLRAMASSYDEPPLRFELTTDAADLPLDAPSLVIGGEQSNTSTVFGDVAILKIFRRLYVGENPDIEIHAALSRTGAMNIAKLFGHVEADTGVGTLSLAMCQAYMTTAADGWELAKASVRDLMAEDELTAADAGGDFAGEAHRLGHTTATLHAELAEAFGTTVAHADELRERAAQMNARLDAALPQVPQLAELADGLRSTYDALAGADSLAVQRIHGDLHLGQVLRTSYRWVFLDFEGEPSKSIEERRAPDTALRDVAGMLRSFDYAANHQAIDTTPTPMSVSHAVDWARRNRNAFCVGYAEVSGHDPRTDAGLLAAYEADKAVYETVYEARNRPSWLPVPLASLRRIIEPPPASAEESP